MCTAKAYISLYGKGFEVIATLINDLDCVLRKSVRKNLIRFWFAKNIPVRELFSSFLCGFLFDFNLFNDSNRFENFTEQKTDGKGKFDIT